ncbi:uncharacterized protein LOC132308158 isoform X2 [Cornus florida]|uniref:uncharacterized protein LOC132308158 isoform X2 n=1 Tax=Cornus florida TaxID=4283 RepID=UPI00289E77B6|nr:uncharacterized protein LOC132308158 isoform X2 [Cornus florida]
MKFRSRRAKRKAPSNDVDGTSSKKGMRPPTQYIRFKTQDIQDHKEEFGYDLNQINKVAAKVCKEMTEEEKERNSLAYEDDTAKYKACQYVSNKRTNKNKEPKMTNMSGGVHGQDENAPGVDIVVVEGDDEQLSQIILVDEAMSSPRLLRTINPSKYKRPPWVSEAKKKLSGQLKKENWKFMKYITCTDGDKSEIIVDMHGHHITRAHIQILFSNEWITSPVINMVGAVIMASQGQNRSKWIFDTMLVPHLLEKCRMFARTKRAYEEEWEHYCNLLRTERDNLGQYRKFFFPSCINHHWCLFVVDLESKTVDYLDSMKYSKFSKNAQIMKGFLEVAFGQKLPDCKTNIVKVTKQLDGESCGLFLIRFMQRWNGGQSLALTDVDPHEMCTQIGLDLILDENNTLKDAIVTRARGP